MVAWVTPAFVATAADGEVGVTLKEEEPDVDFPDFVPAVGDVGIPFLSHLPLSPPPPSLPPAPDVVVPLVANEEIPSVIINHYHHSVLLSSIVYTHTCYAPL